MKKLVKWTNDSFKKNIHPLIIIALFVFHFLLISPFASENIYIVNALIVFLMLKNGYIYVPYFSLDLMFQQNMKKYKIVLIKTQKSIEKYGKANYRSWFFFFMNILETHKNISKERAIVLDKEANTQRILDLFKKKKDWYIVDINDKINGDIDKIRKIHWV